MTSAYPPPYQPQQPGPHGQYPQQPRPKPSAAGFWVGGGLLVGAFVVFLFTIVGIAAAGDNDPDDIEVLDRDLSADTTFSTTVTSREDVDEDGDLTIWTSSSALSVSCRAVDSLGRNRASSEYERDSVFTGGRTWFARYSVDVPDDESVVITCTHPRYVTVGWSESPGSDPRGWIALGGFGLSLMLGLAGAIVGVIALVRRTSR